MEENHEAQTIEMTKYGKFIALIIGIVLIGAGVFTYIRGNELSRVCTEKTTATVTSMREDFESSTDTEGMRYIYYPIIKYQAGGAEVNSEISAGSNPPAYSVGDTVEILYNPNKVNEFIVSGENQNIVWIILTGLGVAFIGAGIFLFIKK